MGEREREGIEAFVHRFEPGTSGRTLLLLHGTGGDENDLVPLAKMISPADAILSPRGQVIENGMPRFFRRLAEGVFDVPDLQRRTHDLADFVAASAKRYGLDPARVVAVGYSNGANVAASLLMLRPETLAGAVLIRAMVPFEKGASGGPSPQRRVLLLAGRRDPYSREPMTERLAGMLRANECAVDVHLSEAGHELTQEDVAVAKRWLEAPL